MREISCVGLGLMGSALARAMLSAGHSTAVWNRSPGKAVALVGLGAKEACSFAEALAASPVLLICIDNPRIRRTKASGSQLPLMRIRCPPANSISMQLSATGAAAG